MAGFSFDGVPADLGALPDGPYEGRANVGIQMFKQFKLTLDLGHDRFGCSATPSPPTSRGTAAGTVHVAGETTISTCCTCHREVRPTGQA